MAATAEDTIDVEFVWPFTADRVHVTGDFCDWDCGIPMKKREDGVFVATIALHAGVKYAYKFVCDGSQWKYDPAQPWECDQYSNINNIALPLPRPASVVSHQGLIATSSPGRPTPSPPTSTPVPSTEQGEPRRFPTASALQANAESFLAWATPSEAIRAAQHLPGGGGGASSKTAHGSSVGGRRPVDPLMAAQRADELMGAAEFGLETESPRKKMTGFHKSRSAAEFRKLIGSEHLSDGTGVFGSSEIAATLMGIPGMEMDDGDHFRAHSPASGISGAAPRTESHHRTSATAVDRATPRMERVEHDNATGNDSTAVAAGHDAVPVLGLITEPSQMHSSAAEALGSVYGVTHTTARQAAAETGVSEAQTPGAAVWDVRKPHGSFYRRKRVESPAANMDLSRRLAAAVAPGRSGAEACLERGTTVESVEDADMHAAAADEPPSFEAFQASRDHIPAGLGGQRGPQATSEGAPISTTTATVDVPAPVASSVVSHNSSDSGLATDGASVSAAAADSAARSAEGTASGRPPRPFVPVTQPTLGARHGLMALAAAGTTRLIRRGTETGTEASSRREGKLVLAMVGLPARGKTSIAFKLRRHLNWMGMRTEIFNVGNYRRKLLGTGQSHSFFDPTNKQAMAQRHAMADAALADMVQALKSHLDVAIFDATNTTRSRREWLRNRLHEEFSDAVEEVDVTDDACDDSAAAAAADASTASGVVHSAPLPPLSSGFSGSDLDLSQHSDADGTRASVLAAAAADAGTTDCGKKMMKDVLGDSAPSLEGTSSMPQTSSSSSSSAVPGMPKHASADRLASQSQSQSRRRASTSGSITGAVSGRTESRCQLVFIESICTDESIIRANVRETKLKSPDYKGVGQVDAVADFLRRIGHYVAVYEPVEDSEGTAYLKLIDVGRKIVAHSMSGFLKGRLLFFLSNLRITPKPIWVTRHGESEFNVRGLLGGDSNLSSRGIAYAKRLATYMDEAFPPHVPLTVWTSTLRRTQQTASFLRGRRPIAWRNLDEIDAGNCDGRTYEWIAKNMPKEYEARKEDKYGYRYPQGESYQDLAQRLEPIMMEVERMETPILIIAHQAVLRVLLGYLNDKDPKQCPSGAVPLHTLIQLSPKAYGVEETRVKLG